MHVVSWKSVFSQVIWYYPNTHGRRHLPCVWSLQSSVTTPSWCTCLCRLLCSIRTLAEKSILHNHWRLFLHHCDKAKWRCRHFALHVPWGACPFCRQDGKEVCPGVHDNGGLVQLRSARIPDTGTIFPCWGCDMRKDGSGLPSYIAHFWLDVMYMIGAISKNKVYCFQFTWLVLITAGSFQKTMFSVYTRYSLRLITSKSSVCKSMF